MNEELQTVAISALQSIPSVSRRDVVNILETIQRCYDGHNDNERFLIMELQKFIDNVK
jgi:hypothetical protein